MAIFGKLFKDKRRAKSAKIVKRKTVKKVKPKVKKRIVRVKTKRHVKRVVRKARPVKKIKVSKKIIRKEVKPKAVPMPVAPKMPVVEKIPDERAFALLKQFRIPLTKQYFVRKEKDLEKALNKIGFPCVMKISGQRIIHRTELGGIKTNIQNFPQAQETFKQLIKIKGVEKVLIQKQLQGTEMIVGIKWDSSFGPVVTAGLGGIYVELLKDVTFRVCPITIVDAEDMVRELKGYEILKGARGQKPINFGVLYDVLIRICRLAMTMKTKEMDINPLICNDEGCFAVDVRIIK